MSDSRRRRKSQQSGGSDDLSDSYEELNTTKETQSSEHTEDHHDSEYDTAGSESDGESQDRTQRESGDGQEEDKPQKKLDDDEDRRNPQYIPKRGTFYEHDDRTADEVNAEEAEKEPEREAKDKKVWKDKGDRWDHDRYNDEEQAPKSHAELIAVYGYDIRNEEGPPRARRRRRYGRGPNKYTRNWEDEDAYGKVSGNLPVHKINKKPNRTGEDFPSLDPTERDGSQKPVEEPVITSAWYSNKNKNKPQNFPPLQQTETQKVKPKQFTNTQLNDNKTSNERNNSTWKKEPKSTPFNQNANELSTASKETEKIVIVKTTLRENKRPTLVQESVSLAASKSRGRGFKANTNNNIVGSRTIESKPKGRGPGPIAFDNRKASAEQEQIVSDMKHMNVSTEGSSYHHTARQNKHFYTQSSSQQHSAVVSPRIHPSHPPQQQPPPSPLQPQQPQQPPQQQQPPQDMTTNRPKRYSSLRQRPPIAEGPPNPAQPNYQAPPPPPQHTYYPPPQGYAPGPYEQPAPVPAPTAPMGGQPVLPGIPPGASPTTYAPHAPPPFLVPPPQFIPPQTAPASITINYVPGPNGPLFQPNYQGYNPPGPPPPQDVGLYQPQGCTYYSPAQQPQQQQQPPAPLRRPKAIPILPPPDNLRGRDRNIQPGPEHQHQLQQEQLVQQQLQQQQEQLAQQQLQQQQQEQFVQQQLQQHQQQLIQEQQQELQQQELLKQQKQLQQQQEQLQLQQQKQLQQQQQELLQQQQLEQEQQEQQRPHHHQQNQQHKQEEQLVHEEHQKEDLVVNEEQQEKEDQQKQENQQVKKEQQVEEEEELKKDQSQEKQQECQQKYLQQQNKNSPDEIESIEKITIETARKDESIFSDSSNVTTEIKVDLQKKLLDDTEKESITKVSKEEVSELIVVVAEDESKVIKSKIVIPDVVPSVPEVEEKLETVEIKTEVQIANSLVEKSLIVDSEEARDITITTGDLVSGKSETDCSIKESAVIEETAA